MLVLSNGITPFFNTIKFLLTTDFKSRIKLFLDDFVQDTCKFNYSRCVWGFISLLYEDTVFYIRREHSATK